MGRRKLSAGTLALLAAITGIFDSLQFVSMGLLGTFFGPIEAGIVFIILNEAKFKWDKKGFMIAIGLSMCPLAAMSYPWLRFVGECSAKDLVDSLKGAPVAETVSLATNTPSVATETSSSPAQKAAA